MTGGTRTTIMWLVSSLLIGFDDNRVRSSNSIQSCGFGIWIVSVDICNSALAIVCCDGHLLLPGNIGITGNNKF